MQAFYAIRLLPGEDLKFKLQQFIETHQLTAAAIISCVGSLSQIKLRLAGAKRFLEQKGNFEIVNLSGTLSLNGCHIHISIANCDGLVLGGHLLPGCLIETTAEIIIVNLLDYQFRREFDLATGYAELQINLLNNS